MPAPALPEARGRAQFSGAARSGARGCQRRPPGSAFAVLRPFFARPEDLRWAPTAPGNVAAKSRKPGISGAAALGDGGVAPPGHAPMPSGHHLDVNASLEELERKLSELEREL